MPEMPPLRLENDRIRTNFPLPAVALGSEGEPSGLPERSESQMERLRFAPGNAEPQSRASAFSTRKTLAFHLRALRSYGLRNDYFFPQPLDSKVYLVQN